VRTSRTVLIGLALVALVAVPSVAIASGGTFTLGSPVTASSASPFGGCGGEVEGADPPSVNYLNTEVEPFVAVNPVNDNILGVYQQDRWSDGGAHGLIASRSSDGGLTWAQNNAEFSVFSD
jgi:hypothetical protein